MSDKTLQDQLRKSLIEEAAYGAQMNMLREKYRMQAITEDAIGKEETRNQMKDLIDLQMDNEDNRARLRLLIIKGGL